MRITKNQRQATVQILHIWWLWKNKIFGNKMSLFINYRHVINTDIKRQCGILQYRCILWGDTHIKIPISSTFIILKSLVHFILKSSFQRELIIIIPTVQVTELKRNEFKWLSQVSLCPCCNEIPFSVYQSSRISRNLNFISADFPGYVKYF